MITLTIILICSVLIYLVWNQCKIFELQNKIKDLNNEFNAKTIEKFIELETDLIKIKDWQNWTDGKTYSLENNIEVLNKSLKENVTLIYRLDSKIKRLGQSKTKKTDYHNLVQRIEKLELEISSPVFNSYKIFIAELENHKQKIRTSKGRVRLNKELIENMIVDGKLEKLKSYTFADLQTILMEYLQCKKVSTSSKIFRLTEKGLLKRYISEVGSLWSVNI